MMQNVIAFPKAAVATPALERATGAKTLFLHVKSTTLIMHLAAATIPVATGSRVGKRV